MAKNNQKCVRLSDEVLNIVEASPGNGFNEKFEKLVLHAYFSVPEREKQLAALDNEIKKKTKELAKIREQINKGEYIKDQLDRFIKCIS